MTDSSKLAEALNTFDAFLSAQSGVLPSAALIASFGGLDSFNLCLVDKNDKMGLEVLKVEGKHLCTPHIVAPLMGSSESDVLELAADGLSISSSIGILTEKLRLYATEMDEKARDIAYHARTLNESVVANKMRKEKRDADLDQEKQDAEIAHKQAN